MRVTAEVARLPKRAAYEALREALCKTMGRETFQVVHLWMDRTHVYLLCEAEDRMALSNGIRALCVSAARRLNQAISAQHGEPRLGRVFVDRYHVTVIATARQAAEALAHGWPTAYAPLPTVTPRTRLLARGRGAG